MKNTKNKVTFATVVRNALSASNWDSCSRLHREMAEKGFKISYWRLLKYWRGDEVPSMEDAKNILRVLRVDMKNDQRLSQLLKVSREAIVKEKEQCPMPSKTNSIKAGADFKTLLKKELNRVGMSACHLSRSMGLTSYSVSRWLNGINKPTFEHAKEAFSILGTNISDKEIYASIGISTPADAAKPDVEVATPVKEKRTTEARSEARPSATEPTISLADNAATLHTLAADLHAIATFLTIAQQSMAAYFATAK